MDFLDFGQKNSHCQILGKGFILWKITGNTDKYSVTLESKEENIITHFLVTEGTVEIRTEDNLHVLSNKCFANFIDKPYIEVTNVSDNAKAYAMFFTNSFITSLLKDTPPFPPSYILKIKKNPTAILSEETAHLFLKRIEEIEEILSDPTHHFCTEKARCVLQMFMMDMANEYLLQEHEATDYADMNRQNMLFQQFIKLIFAHIRETHSVGWYASQLCITPQYLNRIVKNSSQKTTYAHICTALTGAIIRQLENTDCPISLIAEEFNFSDQATLTKFFKRQTGKTPGEYRKKATSV